MSRTWQDNAHEFGALTRQGKDVRLALLVACSVENSGKGTNARSRISAGKTTMAEFATVALGSAGSRERVKRHLDMWNRAAQAGVVRPATELSPEDENLEVDAKAQEWFAENTLRSKTDDDTAGAQKVKDVKNNARSVAKALEDPAFAAKLIDQLSDETREAVTDAALTKSLSQVGHTMPTTSKGVPDPEPRWRRLCRRIALDADMVRQEIITLRDQGRTAEADRAATHLRETLAELVSQNEAIPDTIEELT